MAKVSNSQLNCLADMKDGDVAEILSWHNGDMEPGDVIQRYGDIVIPIGMPVGESYTSLFAAPISAVCFSNKVKILPKGTLIKL